MAYLYRINWKNTIYIGERSNDDDDFIKYHLSPACAWLTDKPSGWEIDLANSAAEQGWKATLNEIHNAGSVSLSEATQKISAKLDSIALSDSDSPYYKQDNYKPGTALQAIRSVLLPQMVGLAEPELLFIESLLISANAWQHKSWNQHINTSRYFGYLTQEHIRSLFAPNQLIEYENKIHSWLPRLYFSFDLKGMPKEIKKLLKAHYRRGIDIIAETEFIDAVGGVITDKTGDSLKKQFERFKKKLKSRLNGSENDATIYAALNKIDDFIVNEIPKLIGGKTTYGEINRLIHKAFDSQAIFQDIKLLSGEESKQLSGILYKFFDSFHVDRLFTQQANFSEYAHNYIKTSMTTALQKKIDAIIEYSVEYSTKQHELYSKQMENKTKYAPKSFLPPNNYMQDGTSIQNQLLNSINASWVFIRNQLSLYGNNRQSMYGEQISIWLATNKKHKDTFYHDAIFVWQPVTADTIMIY